jgi:hypothetical protein
MIPQQPLPVVIPRESCGKGSGSQAGNDLDQLAASTTSITWSNLSSVRYGVTQVAGKVSAVADGRTINPGFGVTQANGAKQPTISGSGQSLVIATDGAATCLVSALQASLDLSQTCIGMMGVLTLVDPPATRSTFHFAMSISVASNIPGMFLARDSPAINPQVGDAYVYFDNQAGSNAFVDPIGQRTLWGKRTLVLMWRTAANYFWCVPPLPIVQVAAPAASSAGNCLFAIGTDGSGTLFDANQYRAWGTFTAPTVAGPSAADIKTILGWATGNELCLNDP